MICQYVIHIFCVHLFFTFVLQPLLGSAGNMLPIKGLARTDVYKCPPRPPSAWYVCILCILFARAGVVCIWTTLVRTVSGDCLGGCGSILGTLGGPFEGLWVKHLKETHVFWACEEVWIARDVCQTWINKVWPVRALMRSISWQYGLSVACANPYLFNSCELVEILIKSYRTSGVTQIR